MSSTEGPPPPPPTAPTPTSTTAVGPAPAQAKKKQGQRKRKAAQPNTNGGGGDAAAAEEEAASAAETAAARKAAREACALAASLLKSKPQKAYLVTQQSLKPNTVLSPLWEKFRIVKACSGQVLDVAYCTQCKSTLTCKERSNGIRNLKRHLDYNCHPKQTPAGEVVGEDGTVPAPPRVDPPHAAKIQFTATAVKYCAYGLRAPESLADPGLLLLIQKALDLQFMYAGEGRLDAAKLIPHPTTVSEHIKTEAARARQEVIEEVLPAIDEGRVAATADCWTEEHSQLHYLVVTLHYINQWHLKNRLLFALPLPADESCTAENLKKFLFEKCGEVGLQEEQVKKLKFVTDNGGDIKKALEHLDRFYCITHALNIVLRTSLEVKYNVLIETCLEECPQANEIVTCGNDWIREVRGALPKTHRLLKRSTLKLSNSQSQGHVPMLRNILDFKQEVDRSLGPRAPTALGDISLNDVSELISFLEPLDLAGSREKAAEMSSGKYSQFLVHFSPDEGDSPMLAQLKATAMEKITPMKATVTLEQCKELVTYLKKIGLSSTFDTTVKQEVTTRWNSHLRMMRSLNMQWETIKTKIAPVKASVRKPDMDSINKMLLDELIPFLVPFDLHTDKLQGQNYPTLPYASLSFERLLKHCLPKEDDSEVLAIIRERAYRLLCEKVMITMEHKIATFLWPRAKCLSSYDEGEKQEIYAAVRAKLKELEEEGVVQAEEEVEAQAEDELEDDESESPIPAKKPKMTDHDLFGDLLVKKDRKRDEVQAYIEMPECAIDDDTDLLLWWGTQVPLTVKFLQSIRFAELQSILILCSYEAFTFQFQSEALQLRSNEHTAKHALQLQNITL